MASRSMPHASRDSVVAVAPSPIPTPLAACGHKKAIELTVPKLSFIPSSARAPLPRHRCGHPATSGQPTSACGCGERKVEIVTSSDLKLLPRTEEPRVASAKANAETPLLSKFGRDLTQAAANGSLDPLVGREDQIERMIQILARRQKNNPVLIGDPGVGKTAVVEGLAQSIVAGEVPDALMHKRIMQLDLAAVLAGASARGEFEKRFKDVLQEVIDSKREIILFIDEVHTIVGTGRAGRGESVIDASNIIKPALARGDLQCIGVTSTEEFRRHIESDKALERRFQPILVPEATVEETVRILRGLAKRYEVHHKVKYTDAAMDACAKFSSQFVMDRSLPDKAIDVFDESGSRVHLRHLRQLKTAPQATQSLQVQLAEVRSSKESAVRREDFRMAAELKHKEVELLGKFKGVIANVEVAAAGASGASDAEDASTADGSSVSREEADSSEPVVTEEDVVQTVAEWTGVPVEKISTDEAVRLVALEGALHRRIVGQSEAVTAVAKAVRRSRAGLKDPSRPIASFMFCGPTGVGKTELCKALASAYFGREDSMIRLDMSELMESHSVSKLIGSPAGYVGYGDENQLTDRIRRKPHSLVLLDEVEKAHPDVLNLLLQLLEDGRLTDSQGRVVSFKNAMIIMTSNVGSHSIGRALAEGRTEGADYKSLSAMVSAQLGDVFQPEFLNRVDEVIAFKPLTKTQVAGIADLEFNKISVRMQEMHMSLSLTDAFKTKVVDESFCGTFGARPLRRVVARLLEDALAESILKEPATEGECIVMDVAMDGQVVASRSSFQHFKTDESISDGQGETVSTDDRASMEEAFVEVE